MCKSVSFGSEFAPHLALMHSRHRCLIDLTSLWRLIRGIACHSYRIMNSWFTLPGAGLLSLIRRFFCGIFLHFEFDNFVMPPRFRLSTTDRGRALGLLQSVMGVREVRRKLSLSHSVIQRLCDRFAATGSVDDRRRFKRNFENRGE